MSGTPVKSVSKKMFHNDPMPCTAQLTIDESTQTEHIYINIKYSTYMSDTRRSMFGAINI